MHKKSIRSKSSLSECNRSIMRANNAFLPLIRVSVKRKFRTDDGRTRWMDGNIGNAHSALHALFQDTRLCLGQGQTANFRRRRSPKVNMWFMEGGRQIPRKSIFETFSTSQNLASRILTSRILGFWILNSRILTPLLLPVRYLILGMPATPTPELGGRARALENVERLIM